MLRRDSNAAIQLIGQGLGFCARLTLAAGIAANDNPRPVAPAKLVTRGLCRNGNRRSIRRVLDRLSWHKITRGENGRRAWQCEPGESSRQHGRGIPGTRRSRDSAAGLGKRRGIVFVLAADVLADLVTAGPHGFDGARELRLGHVKNLDPILDLVIIMHVDEAAISDAAFLWCGFHGQRLLK